MPAHRLLRPSLRHAAIACVLLGLAGCGGASDSLPRQPVEGTITYDGQPLKDGNIQFSPADPNMKDPVRGGAPIMDGKYSIPQDVGLVPGKYNVVISAASAEASSDDAPGAVKALPKELLPAKYNTKSTLTADIKDGNNVIDFPLEK